VSSSDSLFQSSFHVARDGTLNRGAAFVVPPDSAPRRLPCPGALAVAAAIALGASSLTPAVAQPWVLGWHGPAHHHHKESARAGKELQHASKEPFGDAPKGPVQIVITISQQKLHLYSDGIHVADTSIATGVPSLPTPTGVFSVIQKQRFHRSNLYSNAPMPFMQRITWSGVALHEGESIGHMASHGCIRMPHDFAVRLYMFTKLGARVIIARNELRPADFADPHLFVHKAPTVAAADPAKPMQTAQTSDSAQTSDASAAPKSDAANSDTAKSDAAKDGSAQSDTAAAAAQPAMPAADSPPAQSASTDAAKPNAATDSAKSDTPASDVAKSNPTSAAPPAADAATANTPATTTPLTKPAVAAETPHSPITIFVSRKTQRIYVRQDFTPLFDTAVTIDQPDQAFGTHVFTAMEYLSDGSTFRWNVVSMPADRPKPARRADSERMSERHAHGRRAEEPAGEVSPPQSPAEVLARIQIPQDVIDRISAMMVPGSSLVVSDQGLGDETGEGTDFIVVTR
jgi:L,D-transpeptidase catalytic domain